MAAGKTGAAGSPLRFARAFRRAMVVLHRYVGLAIALFVAVASLTGSVVVFREALDDRVNAGLAFVEAPHGRAPRAPLELRARADAQLPAGYSVWEVPLHPRAPDRAVRYSLNYSGQGAPAFDTAYVDPYSGRLIGLRNAQDTLGSIRNIVPFLYRLHVSLALGTVGYWLLGVVAVLWTVDCFVGFYLTLPPSGSGNARKGWASRWKPAWLMRAGSIFAALFSFHRAAGLWFWALLLMFAWSSVALLMRPVYDPVMGLFFAAQDHAYLPELPHPRPHPRATWEQALIRGDYLMKQEADRRGFDIKAPWLISHEPDFGFYRYQVTSSLDPGQTGNTTIWMDSDTLRQVEFHAVTGQDAGETFETWLVQLHFGAVLGLAYRIAICAAGVVAAALSVSGVAIWLRKRRGRSDKRRRQAGEAG